MGKNSIRALLVAAVCGVSTLIHAQTISGHEPTRQRVGEIVTIRGADFCGPGDCERGSVTFVEFGSGTEVPAPGVVLWRDDLIQVRVPVGFMSGGTPTPIPAGPFTIRVTGPTDAWSVDAADEFDVIRASAALDTLDFRQRTQIIDDRDQDGILGDPEDNLARTKDADVADLNNDGFPDLFDSNSNNDGNGTDVILRRNDRSGGFASQPIGPRDDFVSYDVDFADLNFDGLPDLIRTESPDGGRQISVFRNRGAADGYFDLADPDFTAPLTLCPDDVAVGDLNKDGLLDFAVTERIGNLCNAAETQISDTTIFLGAGLALNFTQFGQQLAAPALGGDSSTHDVFFLDADGDGNLDIFTVNEHGTDSGRLWLNDGAAEPTFTDSGDAFPTALAGLAADLNADGFDDFVIAGSDIVTVFLNNDAGTPGQFSAVEVDDDEAGLFYDIELGDIDLDGDIDMVGVTIDGGSAGQVRLWRNNGSGSFTTFGGTDPLPGHINYQRLSADFIDYDQDGDLDVYVTGADTQNEGCFGCVPNQLFANLSALNIVEPTTVLQADVRAQDPDPRILIRLEGPAIDMVPADLAFEVGGNPFGAERIVNLGRVGAETWMVFRPGQQMVAGRQCFDLRVEMTNFPELFDRETNAVCYEEAAPIDRIIAIDRTTSMLRVDGVDDDEKMRSAVSAGKFFVDLSSADDRFGALSFQYIGDADDSGDVDVVPEVVRLEGPNFGELIAPDRITMRTDIGNIWPTPVPPMRETSIGAPAQEALRILDNAPVISPITRDIVLITDGIENRDPRYEDDVEEAILDADPPVTLYTISVGADADDPFLQEIAENTGGQWVNLLTGEASFFLASRLADIYKRFDADIRDELRFFYREGVPPCVTPFGAGCLRSDTFNVPAGLEWMTVAIHWHNPSGPTPDLSHVQLFDPGNAPVTHAPPTVESYATSSHKSYRIRQPEPGLWTYALFLPEGNLGADLDDIEFFVAASAPSILALRPGPVEIAFLEPNGIDAHLRLLLVDSAPILGASVTAEIRDPSGSKTTVTFLDDGANDDGAANDGIYGHVHTTFERGAYLAYAEATGIDNDGDSFTRYAVLPFQYPDFDKPADRPEGGLSLPPGGCGCLPDPEDWSVASFAGGAWPHSPFDRIAGGGPALGVQLQRQWTSAIATGVFLGHDRFDNDTGGDDFSFTHLSPEVQFQFTNDLCPRPSIHAGVGAYRDQDGDENFGYNLGASLGVCVTDRVSLSLRYDYRKVTDIDVDYSSLVMGARWSF